MISPPTFAANESSGGGDCLLEDLEVNFVDDSSFNALEEINDGSREFASEEERVLFVSSLIDSVASHEGDSFFSDESLSEFVGLGEDIGLTFENVFSCDISKLGAGGPPTRRPVRGLRPSNQPKPRIPSTRRIPRTNYGRCIMDAKVTYNVCLGNPFRTPEGCKKTYLEKLKKCRSRLGPRSSN